MVEDSARAPFPVQQVDGALQIMSCTTGRIVGLEVTERKKSSQEWQTILEVESFDVALERNQLISETAVKAGTVVTKQALDLSPGDEILVGVSKAPDTTAYAAFTVPDGGLPTEEWLQPDGKVTEDACSLYTTTNQSE
ncbi:hypothetical protein [Agreia bicolorata]|nr:hypothetical protein [Agreia bicolorata]